ncbi:hypothetical protein N0V93_009978 [Gnomoniopsis smithogilvyi]|uniref:F-box domain-containing protein n=1 Tax=Gnomoniopsis smithogilvyi TaxID=1191159 RepID=A0A9W8YIU1_9PEZI|nr:hypothetical protein N0V93_009978 [Gnomoniopsis smithogilvyi]
MYVGRHAQPQPYLKTREKTCSPLLFITSTHGEETRRTGQHHMRRMHAMEQTPTLTFLELPDEARRSIYALAGLRRPCPIDLLARSPRSDNRPPGYGSCNPCWQLKRLEGIWSTQSPNTPICACSRLPLALLRVCHRVHDEALDVLLSTNRFVVRARAGRPEMLAPLATSIPEAQLARMTSLIVRLNCWPCPWGHDETRSSPRLSPDHCCLCSAHSREADPALSRSCPEDSRMLDVWKLVCARLGSGLKPRQLDLTLICDIEPADDGSITSRLLEPLKVYLPLLKSCTLRLGRASKERYLTKIARQTSHSLMELAEAQETKPFPFDQLPWELKIRILKCTHLGPPWLADYDLRFESLDVINGRLLKQPLRTALSPDTELCCDRCTGTFLDCCCANTYAAFSPTCSCRTLPTALFHVSRGMRRAAIETFYPDANLSVRHDNLGAILDILPPAALPLLRRLTIAFTPAQCYYWFGRAPDPPHPEWHVRGIVESQWPGGLHDMPPMDAHKYRTNFRAALARLATEACVARLELELDLQAVHVFSQLFDEDSDPDDEICFRWTYDLYIDVAEMICAEFQELKGVRFRLATFVELEPWLAREVMGEKFMGPVEPPRRRRRSRLDMIPAYHRMDQRLKGSHYHEDMEVKKQ